jgi:hypothetical protein
MGRWFLMTTLTFSSERYFLDIAGEERGRGVLNTSFTF